MTSKNEKRRAIAETEVLEDELAAVESIASSPKPSKEQHHKQLHQSVPTNDPAHGYVDPSVLNDSNEEAVAKRKLESEPDLEAPFPPDLRRVSRTPGAFREGGDPALRLSSARSADSDNDSHNNDPTVANSSQSPLPVTELLVSATLVTEATVVPTAVVLPVGADASSTSLHLYAEAVTPEEQLPGANGKQRRRKTKTFLLVAVVVAGVVALAVGLLLALTATKGDDDIVESSINENNINDTASSTATDVTSNGSDLDANETVLEKRQMHHAVTWGTFSNCEISTAAVELKCGNGGTLIVWDSANAICNRPFSGGGGNDSFGILNCIIQNAKAEDEGQAVVLFACEGRTNDSQQATAKLPEVIVDQCSALIDTTVTGNNTLGDVVRETFGGRTIKYLSLARYCRGRGQEVTTEWHAEAVSDCQAQSRNLPLADGEISQLYCYDQAICAVQTTCTPELVFEGDDEEYSVSDDEEGGESTTASAPTIEQSCTGSTACSALVESVLIKDPNDSSRPQCTSLPKEGPSVNTMWQLVLAELDNTNQFLRLLTARR